MLKMTYRHSSVLQFRRLKSTFSLDSSLLQYCIALVVKNFPFLGSKQYYMINSSTAVVVKYESFLHMVQTLLN